MNIKERLKKSNKNLILVLVLAMVIAFAGMVNFKIDKMKVANQENLKQLQMENENYKSQIADLTEEVNTYKNEIDKVMGENAVLKENNEKNQINFDQMDKKLNSIIEALKR